MRRRFTRGSQRFLAVMAISFFFFVQMSVSLPVKIGPIQTNILELTAISTFLLVIGIPWFHSGSLWKYYLALLVISIIPLSMGIIEYGVERALRSYQWVVYIGTTFLFKALSENRLFVHIFLKGIFCTGIVLITGMLILRYSGYFDGHALLKLGGHLRIFALYSFFYALYQQLRVSYWNTHRILYLALSVIPFLFLFSLRTRAYYIAIAFGFLVFVIVHAMKKDRRRLRKTIQASAILAFIVSSIFYIVAVFEDRLFAKRLSTLMSSDISMDETAAYRLAMWERVWNLLADNMIFGMGFGRYLDFQPKYFGGIKVYDSYAPQMMHNSWLEALYSGGMITAIGLCALMCKIVHSLFHAYRSEHNPLFLMAMAFVASYVVISFFGGLLSTPAAAIPFWAVTGLVVGIAEKHINIGRPGNSG